ncbi:MAG TPA: HAD hydrolase-like protein [Thermoanaerobaculia bacterium]|nr:HAD hydrolase-like protein [Thermoanaerobaculia bacterium]
MAARPQAPAAPRSLLLFDIDGTLVDCGGQPLAPFAAALIEVFGTAGDIDGYNFSGCTDPQAVCDLMTGAGFPVEEVRARLPRVRDLYLPRLESTLDRGRMRLLPGVEEVLQRLALRPDVELALLTGNWEAGARTKLARFDLNRFFPFGAFGGDGDGYIRSSLPPIALARAAERRGSTVAAGEALIVGDSLQDVACARAHGIKVLAVATGRTPAAALAAAGADWVVPELGAAEELCWARSSAGGGSTY